MNLNLNERFQKFDDKDIRLIIKDTLGYRKNSVNRCPASLSKGDIKDVIRESLSQNE